MIRPITCVGFILACASGLYLYQAKHRVTVIDHEIQNVVHETSVTRAQIRVLVAEWALLNQPNRLQQFADQLSALKPTDPSQYASWQDLDSRLPPITGTPSPVLSRDVVAQDLPALTESAQVTASTGSPVPATIGTPASPASAPTAAIQPAAQDAAAAPALAEPKQRHETDADKTRVVAEKVQVAPATDTPAPLRPAADAVPPVAAEAAQPSEQDAAAVRLSAELARLEQQHAAEAARNRLLQAEADRLATQIEQRQRALAALRAVAQAAKQTASAPAASRPAAAAAPQPLHQDAAAVHVAAEFAQMKQQHDADAARDRSLQAEVDHLASQIGQQHRSLDVGRPKLVSAKQPPAVPVAAAPPPTLSRFNAVESIISRLRQAQTQPREPPPSDLQTAASASSAGLSAPAITAQFRPQARLSSPWLELMNARAALRAGDAYASRQRLEAAHSALLSQPSRRHFYAADQIAMAVALIDAGRTLPAFYFLDLAIANASSAVPYAAENVVPGPYAP